MDYTEFHLYVSSSKPRRVFWVRAGDTPWGINRRVLTEPVTDIAAIRFRNLVETIRISPEQKTAIANALTVICRVDWSSGHVQEVQILESTGSDDFDQEAITLIRKLRIWPHQELDDGVAIRGILDFRIRGPEKVAVHLYPWRTEMPD